MKNLRLRESLYFYQGRPGNTLKRGMGTSNTIIIGDQDFIMIDPGESIPKCVNSLENRMRADGLDLQRVKILLFTHVHFDHSNAAGFIQKKSQCQIYTHPHDTESIENPIAEYRRMMVPIMNLKEFPRVPLRVAKFFTDIFTGKRIKALTHKQLTHREQIPHGSVNIEVLFSPGHAPGHIAYYIPEYKALLAGDIIVPEIFGDHKEMDNIYTGGCVNNTESSWKQIIQTLEFLKTLEIELFIPGHGQPIDDRAVMRDFISRNLQSTNLKTQKVLTHISEKGSCFSEIFKKMCQKVPLALKQTKKLELLNILNYLEQENKVKSLSTRNKTCWIPISS